MRIGISGPGESGKDIAGEWLRDNTILRYTAGTSAFAADIVFDRWGKDRYPSSALCWSDRRNHRETWARIIGEFNQDDPVALYRRCLEEQDILTGIRFKHEFLAIKEAGLCDLWIWIQRDCVPPDPTMEYSEDDCDISVTNNGTIEQLYGKLAKLSECLGILTQRNIMQAESLLDPFTLLVMPHTTQD